MGYKLILFYICCILVGFSITDDNRFADLLGLMAFFYIIHYTFIKR